MSTTIPASYVAAAGTAQIRVRNRSCLLNELTYTCTCTTLSESAPATFVITQPLAASCNNPPAARAGQIYTHTLTASGGTPPYYWMPKNIASQVTLSSNGTISGAFLASEGPVVSFTAEVMDAHEQSVTISCQIVVATAPTISAYSPTEATACGPGFTLSVAGAGFQTGTLVGIGTSGEYSALSTVMLSSTALTAAVLRSHLTTPGTVNIAAGYPLASSSIYSQYIWSEARPLTIRQTPRVQSVSPARAAAGSADLQVTLTGSYFVTGATRVMWQAGTAIEALQVTRWSTAELGVLVPSRLLATAGTARIRVVNVEPANQGGELYSDSCSPPVTFTVEAPALQITTTQLPAGRVNADYRATVAATGGTSPYRFTLVSGSVPGLTLSSDGVLSGRPTQTGSYTLRIQAADSAATPQTAQRDFTLVIEVAAFQIDTSQLPTGKANVDYRATVTASGGTPPYRFTLVSGSVPGLTLSSDGVLGGRPTQVGSFALRIQATDSATTPQTAQREFTLVVEVAPLQIEATQLPAGKGNSEYRATVTATGGTPPYRFTLVSGSVPGLTLSTDGVLSGRPAEAGSFTLRIQVTDSSSTPQTAQRDFTLSVAAPDLAVASPAELASAMVGAAYSASFTASGGTPPYRWDLESGEIAGLTLNADGTLSGTPSRDGRFTIVVRVTAANSLQAPRSYTLAVGLPQATATLSAASSAGQTSLTLRLGAAYPVGMAGLLRLTFAPDAAGLPADGYMDPALQFAAGGTTLAFTVPANSATITLPQNGALQLGTVAGTATVTLTQLRASNTNTDVPLASRPSTSVVVPRQAPVIVAGSVQITGMTAGGFAVELDGYTTPRDLRSATFTFTAASGARIEGQAAHTVQLATDSATWFNSTDGRNNGSRFHLRVPFTLSGSSGVVASVSVTLENSVGTSSAVSGGVR
jgi:hypothetical protein